MELSLREAEALHDSSIGAQHITLALLIPREGTVPRDPGGPRRTARIGARRDPRPLPQGELTACLEPAGSFLR